MDAKSQPMIDRSLPLVDLHRHLDGNLRLETIIALGRQHNLPLPAWEPETLRPFVQVISPQPSLVDFLSKFDYLIPAFVDYDACRRIAYENVEDAHNEGVCYVELRFSPLFVASGHGLDPSAVVEAIADGVAAGVRDTGVQARIIGIIQRHLGLESAARELEALLQVRALVTGVDLAGAEAGWPGEMFTGLFGRARDAGWHITVHAGEAAGPEYVWQALRELGAERIGHGVRAIEDPRLVETLAREQIGVECCLTSNLQTNAVPHLASHPLRRFLEAGVLATINTDDPSISGIDLPHEYNVAAPAAGISPALARQAQRNGLAAAFLTGAEKAALLGA
jgi:adenosine deaminase